MTPPKGVTSNFVDPYSAGPIFIVVGSILIGIMMLFVAVRVYTKAHITRKVHWDDCQSCLPMALSLVYMLIPYSDLLASNRQSHGCRTILYVADFSPNSLAPLRTSLIPSTVRVSAIGPN